MRHRWSHGAMLITAPSESERRYEMAVRLARAELLPTAGYVLSPWLVIRADVETEVVTIAAGVRARREEPTV